MATWQQRYAHLLEGLDDAQRGRVLDSLQSGYLEGFEPTEADVRVLVRYTLGEITSLEAFADGAARYGQTAREARDSRAR